MTNPERKLLAATLLRRSIRNQTEADAIEAFLLLGAALGLDRLAVVGTLETKARQVDDYEMGKKMGWVVEERN